MKRKILICLILIWSLVAKTVAADDLMDITRAAGYEVSEENRPKSSIVIDGETGAVLWQDNPDAIRDPASMSKLMTLYLVYEAMAKGQLSEDTVITAKPTDQAIAGIYAISNNNIVAGVDYTVDELITMTVVPSSNVATVMLANYLSNDDPDAFLDMMNAKSKELGMTNTSWMNASGAAAVSFEGYYNPTRYNKNAPNQTTARDLAILTYHFLKDYPEIIDHTKNLLVTVKAGTPYEETFSAYNHSLEGAIYGIEGANGLKTGSSPGAAFNYVMTVKRGDQGRIAVIMGVGDWYDQNGEFYRHPFGNALVEKSYADYEYKKVLSAGQQTIDGKKYDLDKDLYATVAKGAKPTFVVEDDQLKLANGLETVSPLIKNSLKVKPVNPVELISRKVSSKSKSLLPLLSQYWYFLFLLPLLILAPVCLLWARRKRQQSKS
ncbi:DUF1958 domain-containing protein [Streptococcus cuniculipharyngis]|uniref:D-alanyl-D-alanine carboxypeptidase n=1 Tax=Streptococcus cuniculipharyngis TaxID=1562651 RepID=A0A5C5SEL3_9STRE|nr:DUF1958 domain-containing protein [Streptococcus cuniculipharyngis]TWS99249.1 D-alanyl-D-alanine carboxypeptidase [Streptococcus cuniculipharyngis]